MAMYASTHSKRRMPGMSPRHRGVGAVLAMMFLVIFGSLAAAMAIVSQGNLATADSQLKIHRSLAAAETGMRFVQQRLSRVAAQVQTDQGVITAEIAQNLWSSDILPRLEEEFTFTFADPPSWDGTSLHIGPITMAADAPTFSATLTPHFVTGEKPVIRARVVAHDGVDEHRISRSVSMDFEITKRIPYAILSKSQIMIGRNVMVEGPIGSTFMDTDLEHGHPIQMLSDFHGLNDDLDADLEALVGTLISNDANGDNRIRIASDTETDGMSAPEDFDYTGDGYIDEMDLFLKHFDLNGDERVTLQDMQDQANDSTRAEELFHLMDTAGYGPGDPPPGWLGDPDDFHGRAGYNDGVIDARDRYAKVQGSVYINAEMEDWNDGAANGAYQDYFQGPIRPDHNEPPLTFGQDGSSQNGIYDFGPEDFNVDQFRDMTDSDLHTQASAEAAKNDPDDPDSPQPLGQQVTEEVPYGAAFPYEYYDRPVFENMTFENVLIPKGTNALFRNCTFIGVTFIETETSNTDPDFNYAGMQESDGTPKYPDRVATVDGQEVYDTKSVSNNIRFEDCTFEGAIITDSPQEYTHVRNKLEFNGATQFNIEDSQHLTPSERELYRRSTILAPHYSVEIGSFSVPDSDDDHIDLSGTIVAGLLDMRGDISITGTLLTTFSPVRDQGSVVGDTSPWFNTTIGYFGPEYGDFEAEMPDIGMGKIHLRYDPTLPLPDGIRGPIHFEPLRGTYTEGGA